MTPLFLLKPLADVHIIYIHIYDIHIIYIYIERYKYIDIDIDINRSIVVLSAMGCFSSDTYIRKKLAESTSSARGKKTHKKSSKFTGQRRRIRSK